MKAPLHTPRQTTMLATGLALLLLPMSAGAQGFTDLGQDIASRTDGIVEVNGYFRTRGELLYNLDLDRGLTPSGQPLYPVPLAEPNAQTLNNADMRLRTDINAYAPVGAVALKMRLDFLDNLAFGSTPDGPPQSTTSQQTPVGASAVNIKRAYGQALTPLGLLAVGRMGSHWGLGMLTHSGDGVDDDSGDAADRVAFMTPLFGNIWALAYDISWSGPTTQRKAGDRVLDVDASDDVRAITFATMRYRTDESVARRRAAGRTTVDYGVYFSYRWQENDVPASYLSAAAPPDLSPSQVVARDLRAHAIDGWFRLVLPALRIEAELAMIQATISQASLLPGVNLREPITSTQFGGAVETELWKPGWRVAGGLDFGFASGDAAPGFGAYPGPFDAPGQPGDLDGPQANPPYDNTINNFRFHPDYRVDRIMFREIIGTVTDAVYVRPHVTWHIANVGPGQFKASLAGVASWAMEPTSTPGGARPLGVELDPTLSYESYGTFSLALEHAIFFPLAGFDNPEEGLSARSAQLLRVRLALGF